MREWGFTLPKGVLTLSGMGTCLTSTGTEKRPRVSRRYGRRFMILQLYDFFKYLETVRVHFLPCLSALRRGKAVAATAGEPDARENSANRQRFSTPIACRRHTLSRRAEAIFKRKTAVRRWNAAPLRSPKGGD